MTPFWHPISGVFLDRPRTLVSPAMIRMLLAAGPVALRYAGDRMGTALGDGTSFDAVALDGPPARGAAFLAATEGIVDVWRAARVDAGGVLAVADADPAAPCRIPADRWLASVPAVPDADVGLAARRRRRRRLEREERRRGPDPDPDPAATVRTKYDAQAAHYAARAGKMLEEGTVRWFEAAVPAGARVLVVGSGSGREAVEWSEAGYRVHGIDFSPAMTARAVEYAAARGSDATFECRDLRSWDPVGTPFDAAYFTYDVYSFLPGREARRDAAARLLRGVRPGGALFLSARLAVDARTRRHLALQHGLAARAGIPWEAGDSHTRYLGAEGRMGRAFVHLFDPLALVEEVESTGWRARDARPGHVRFDAPASR